MSGSKGEETLAEYKRAFEVMSAKKVATKRDAPGENDDDVQFVKSNKRQAVTAPASSSKRRSKASGFTPTVSPSSASDPATVLSNLNTKVVGGKYSGFEFFQTPCRTPAYGSPLGDAPGPR